MLSLGLLVDPHTKMTAIRRSKARCAAIHMGLGLDFGFGFWILNPYSFDYTMRHTHRHTPASVPAGVAAASDSAAGGGVIVGGGAGFSVMWKITSEVKEATLTPFSFIPSMANPVFV